MTLNIAATSRYGVYLTGDFRLTYSGLFRFWHKTDLSIQKIVPIGKLDWIGLASFCGIARFGHSMDVGNWIFSQTRPEAPTESVEAVVSRLRTINNLLPPRTNLSIVMVGFRKRQPFLRLLSNYQDLDCRQLKTKAGAMQFFRTSARLPEVRFFGDGTAFREDDRQRLLALLGKNAHGEIIRALAEVNARASTLSRTISPESLVGFLRPSGDGGVVPYIGDHTDYFPDWAKQMLRAQNIIGYEPKLDSNGRALKPSLTGMTLKTGKTRDGQDYTMTMISVRNAGQAIFGAGPSAPNSRLWHKTAGDNEPDVVTFPNGASIRSPKVPKRSDR